MGWLFFFLKAKLFTTSKVSQKRMFIYPNSPILIKLFASNLSMWAEYVSILWIVSTFEDILCLSRKRIEKHHVTNRVSGHHVDGVEAPGEKWNGMDSSKSRRCCIISCMIPRVSLLTVLMEG